MDKRLVRLTWMDAEDPTNDSSWYSDKEVDDFAANICEVISVGWIKSKTDKYITLVADYYINDDSTTTWGRPTKVPVGMVTSIEDLTVKEVV